MAILVTFHGKGIDRQLYDVLLPEVRNPDGLILHAAAFDVNGDARVADIWESQEQLDRFVAERLMPLFQKHNAPPPEVAIYPLHNIDAYPGIDQYRAK